MKEIFDIIPINFDIFRIRQLRQYIQRLIYLPEKKLLFKSKNILKSNCIEVNEKKTKRISLNSYFCKQQNAMIMKYVDQLKQKNTPMAEISKSKTTNETNKIIS